MVYTHSHVYLQQVMSPETHQSAQSKQDHSFIQICNKYKQTNTSNTSQKHSQRDVQRQIELKTKSFQTWHRTQSPQAKHTPHMLSFGTRIPEVQSRKHPQSAKN